MSVAAGKAAFWWPLGMLFFVIGGGRCFPSSGVCFFESTGSIHRGMAALTEVLTPPPYHGEETDTNKHVSGEVEGKANGRGN